MPLSRLLRRALPYTLVSVLVIAGSLAASAEQGSPADGDRAAEPPVTEEMRLAMAAAQARYEREQARRRTPEAREERRRSRSRFSDLGAADARGAAKDAFGEIFRVPASKPFAMPPGKRVERFFGDRGALLVGDDPSGNQLVESTGAPLTSKLGSGERAFVDLSLRREGNAFAPRNPATPTTIAADGMVRVGREAVSIRVAQAGATDAVEENGRLFFANALRDTDAVVTPTPAGAAFAFHVRSADAPESVLLDLAPPAGAELRLAASGESMRMGVEVVRGGETIGRVNPPAAWDADGEPVTVGYSIDGTRVSVNFPHRAADVRYPLYVDPDYEDFGSTWVASDWSEWGTHYNAGSWGTAWYPAKVANAVANYNSGWWGAVAWRNVRGYIRHLDGWYFTHYHAWSCGKLGILNSSWAIWKNVYAPACYQMQTNQLPSLPNTDSSYGDWAMLQLYMEGTGARNWQGYAQVSGVRTYLADVENPTVTSVYNSTGGAWTKGNQTVTISATANDAGLGMSAFNLYLPTGAATDWIATNGVATDLNGACTGVRGARCPQYSVTGSFDFNTNIYANGVHTVGGNAYDRLSKPRTYSTTLKVDKDAPTISSISGVLWDRRTESNPRNELWPTPQNSYGLSVTGADPVSGVKSVEWFAHPVHLPASGYGTSLGKFERTVACDACPYPLNLSKSFEGYRGKTLRITVVATDFAGNPSAPTQFTVRVAPIDPERELYQFGVNSLGPDQVPTSTLESGNFRLLRRTFSQADWNTTCSADVHHTCRFAELDRIMKIAFKNPSTGQLHDVSVLPILGNKTDPPAWRTPTGAPCTQGQVGCAAYVWHPPDTAAELDEWQKFVTAVSQRYGPVHTPSARGKFWEQNPDLPYRPIRAWEIWNEPNLGNASSEGTNGQSYWPADGVPSQLDPRAPEEYYWALKRARDAIRGVDALARIVMGGLAGPSVLGGVGDTSRIHPPDFLRRVVAEGNKNLDDINGQPHEDCMFDAVSYHPYAELPVEQYGGAGPDDISTYGSTLYLSTLVKAGQQMWVTEFGWSVTGPYHRARVPQTVTENGVTRSTTTAEREADQAARLDTAVSALTGSRSFLRLGPVVWYQIKDHIGSPDQFGYHTGLQRSDGVLRPAWTKFRYYADRQPALALPAVQPLTC